MKFLPLRDFDVVTSALNFDTPDCHVTGGCDLYTTKAAGSDKKLYKSIDRFLETQHAALLEFGSSLSPPQRTSLNLSRSSPFGPLSEIASRRKFAYLIATLNASHPDYDFSQVLQPADFKRERVLRTVMANLDTTLHSARPNAPPTAHLPIIPHRPSKKSKAVAADTGSSPPAVSGIESPPWGPHMWVLIDKEMTLKECCVFSYQPASNPFEEDAAAIWSLHYFFFNRDRKRVAYLYVRGVPIMSHSYSTPYPLLRTRHRSDAISLSPASSSSDLRKRRLGQLDESVVNKRARHRLDDREVQRIQSSDDWDDYADDGLTWNRDRDGVLDLVDLTGSCDDFQNDDFVHEHLSNNSSDPDDDDLADEHETSPALAVMRGVSEDFAGSMEIE